MRGTEAGEQYLDDPDVSDDEDLWRRIFHMWWVMDKNSGERKLSTQAFEDSPDGSPLSVTLAARLEEDRDTALERLQKRFPEHGVASLTAGHARKCDQIIHPDPTDEDPAHAFVAGPKSKSKRRCLQRGAIVLLPPPIGA